MIAWISAFTIALFLFVGDAYAEGADIIVVDVRRNIPLADNEPVYKDFYLNAGEDKGLKKNLVITATRKLQIRDASGAQSIGDIDVPVGQLRILAVYGRVAVAREFKILSREDFPMLEQVGIMSGDKIDLRGSFVENSKPSSAPKRKTSSNDASKDSTTPEEIPQGQVAAALLNPKKGKDLESSSDVTGANKDLDPNMKKENETTASLSETAASSLSENSSLNENSSLSENSSSRQDSAASL